jgi:hypothetical protein
MPKRRKTVQGAFRDTRPAALVREEPVVAETLPIEDSVAGKRGLA